MFLARDEIVHDGWYHKHEDGADALSEFHPSVAGKDENSGGGYTNQAADQQDDKEEKDSDASGLFQVVVHSWFNFAAKIHFL